MTAAIITRGSPKRSSNLSARRPALTAVVCGVTLAVSIAALASPALMRLFIRNPQLQTGQWWRAVTPVLVQPDGWGAGILIGVTIACLVLARRRIRAHPLAPAALTVLFGLAAPIALYYGLRAAGAGIVPSLIAGTVPPAGSAIVQAVRHRRLDALAVTVLTLLVLSAGMSVLAGSPRFLLAKDAALTAVWGTWFLLSLRGRRPLTFRFTRPLLEGHRIFDPRTVNVWRQAAENVAESMTRGSAQEGAGKDPDTAQRRTAPHPRRLHVIDVTQMS